MITVKTGAPLHISGRVRDNEAVIDITGWDAVVGFRSAFSGKIAVSPVFAVLDQNTHTGQFTFVLDDTSMFGDGEYMCDILITPPQGTGYQQGYTQSIEIKMKEGIAE